MFYNALMEREPLFVVARRRFDAPEFRVSSSSSPRPRPSSTASPATSSRSAGRSTHIGDASIRAGTAKPGTHRSCSAMDARSHSPKSSLVTRSTAPYEMARTAVTFALESWRTGWLERRLYRVTLEDGTELVASGDHRFLSNRGWKHVTGSEQGRARRPHLTINNKLMGTGAFALGPRHDADYRRGYLCGMIRGDANPRSYAYVNRSGTRTLTHQFRLALVDMEGLPRTQQYLAELMVPTRSFVFQEAIGRRVVHAIDAHSLERVSAIQDFCVDGVDDPTTDRFLE